MPGDKHYMSKSDAGRIQSSQAKGGGDMSSGGFAARAQGAGDRNVNTGIGQHHGTGSHGHGGSGGAAPGAKK